MLVRFFLILALGWVGSARAAAVTLSDLNPGDEAVLKRELPALFGEKPGLSVLDEAIRILIGRGHYENVFVQRTNGHLELIGKPLRLIEKIRFTGVQEIDESDLRDILEMKPGDRFDRKKAVAAGERIKNYYGEHAYFNAIVEINFKKSESKNIEISYDIQEKIPCMIVGIEYVTPNTDLHEKLQSRFRRVLKKPLTTDRIRRFLSDLNEFLIDGRYLASEVIGPDAKYNSDKTQAFLTFQIKESYRWEFYFNGYSFLTLADLYSSLDLGNYERKNVDPASEGAERLRKEYLSRGFPTVQIETKIINPAQTYLKRVYYNINEGARVRISAIDVQGRISRPSKYYSDFITSNSSELISSGFYNRQDLDNGIKNLTTELRNQGFLRAKVLSSRLEYNNEKNKVTVVVLLEEGPQTQVRALDFEGNSFFSNFELSQVTGLQINTPLKLDNFEASIDKLKSFYHNLGFLEMKLLNEGEDLIQYNEKGTQARIIFKIFEGPRIRVHSIVVEGNTFTKSRVILKEADFHAGEILTPQKLEDATARLNKLGLFSRVDIHTLEEGTNVSERTLVISIGELTPGLVSFGGGVNNERNFTVRGFTGVSYNNINGTGRGVSGRFELKENIGKLNFLEHSISVGYLEPFIFDSRTRGRVNVTENEHIFEYRPNNALTRIDTTDRVDFFAERALTNHTKLNWKAWSLEAQKERDRYSRCLPSSINEDLDPTKGKCPAQKIQVGTFGPIVEVDYRDNPFLPTRGSFTHWSADYSEPRIGSSQGVKFFHTEANYTYYQRLHGPRWVWANSLRGGYVANLLDEQGTGVPPSYAFILGGMTTLRAYDLASDVERVPKQGDDGFNITSATDKLIKNDSYYYLIKSEIRFPIWKEHGGVLFYDGGEVHVSGFHFTRPYKDNVGIGYRYNTPVGPVAVDLALKVHPLPGEHKYRLNISIGTF